MEPRRQTVVYFAIVADLAIATAKFIVAGLSHSSAMLAEAIHTVVDTCNGFLMLLGLRRSARPPDQTHPFGYGKEVYFWTLIVTISIFGLGGGMSIYEGVVRLFRPQQLESAMWSYIVLGVAAVFDGGSLAMGLRRLRHSTSREDSLLTALRRSKDPVVFTIVFQDAAAIAGVLIALVGIVLAHRFQNPRFDAAASILIGGLLAAVSLLLARECSHLLLGERAHRATIEAVRRLVEKDPDVESASHPLTMQMGPDEILLNLEIEFRDGLSTEQLESVIERLEKGIRDQEPDIKRIFIEANAFASRHHRRKPAA